ncbi:ATP-binding protein [bacterium]|nr:ATP-binding protein [bacterium]
MTVVQNLIPLKNNQLAVVENNNVKKLSFKAEKDSFVKTSQSPFVNRQLQIQEAREKEIKKQKRKQNLSWALGIGASATIILALAGPYVMKLFGKGGEGITDSLRSTLEKNATNIKPVDVSNMRIHKRESICDDLLKALDDIMEKLKRSDIEAKKGRRATALMMEGPGGTGKTEQANQLAKTIIEKYPGSEYYIPDLSVIDSSGIKGQSEQMMVEISNKLGARADAFLAEANGDARKAKKVIVLLDEFDKVAMKDNSLNAKNSNDSVSTLKILINALKKRNNVVLIANTNKADSLEGAIDSRMATKVTVGYLTKKQQKAAFEEWIESVDKNLIDTSLRQKIDKIAEIITREGHEPDFRKFEELIDNAIINSKEGEAIVLKDMVDALTHPNLAKRYHFNKQDIADLQNLLR